MFSKICILTLAVITSLVFDKVFLTSKMIIDEEFHLPQGLAYCNFTFNTWNPKITTLPGLYLITALLLGPFNLCTVYWLRFVNIVAAAINFLLFYHLFKINNHKRNWTLMLSSINLSILPPLYFFNHLYYTDVLSVTSILLLLICSKKEKHLLASICGIFSVLMRQTNIIWLTMVFGQYTLTQLLKESKTSVDKKTILNTILELLDWRIYTNLSLKVWLNICAYLTVLISFLLFVVINGSIVVGDKKAHSASLHVPQLFYFIMFCLFFTWPYLMVEVVDFFNFILKKKVASLIVLVTLGLVVHYNTLEHPYLLADNRHYTFYVWNRLYARYLWFRYAMIPVYYFGYYAFISKILTEKNLICSVAFVIATILVLVPQKMIEIRYFLLPFILYRVRIKDIKLWQLLLEFLFYLVINIVTFNVFFNKEIYWSNFNDIQRLIW